MIDNERLVELMAKEKKREDSITFWLAMAAAFVALILCTVELLAPTGV